MLGLLLYRRNMMHKAKISPEFASGLAEKEQLSRSAAGAVRAGRSVLDAKISTALTSAAS